MTSGEQPLSAVWVPLVVGDEVRGDHLAPEHRPRGRLQRVRRRAPDDARREPERRPRERPPDRRDPPAARRAGDGQRGRPGAVEPARPRRRSSSSSASRCAGRSRPTSATSRSTTRERDEIEFPYFNESGTPTGQEPFAFGEGLTSRIISAARAAPAQPRVGLGRARDARASGPPAKSYPRRADPRRRPGDRRDQRPEHARGRAASASPTPACCRRSPPNVGVAIQNARLYQEAHRRGRRDGGPRRGRPGDLGDARRPRPSSSGSASGSRSSCRPTRSRSSSPTPSPARIRAILAHRRARRRAPGGHDPRGRGDHRRRHPPTGRRSSSTTPMPTPRTVDDPGHRGSQRRRSSGSWPRR